MSLKSRSRWSALDESERKKIRHNVKGAICVFRGFQGEIQESLHELKALCELSSSTDIDAQLEPMREVLETDIDPCLEFLDKTSLRLSAQLETFQFLCADSET